MQVYHGKAAHEHYHRAAPAGIHHGGMNAVGKVFNFGGYPSNQGSTEGSHHEPLSLTS